MKGAVFLPAGVIIYQDSRKTESQHCRWFSLVGVSALSSIQSFVDVGWTTVWPLDFL